MKKCTIYYHTLTDEMRKEDKLEWFSESKIRNIPFDHIQPDKNNNWLELTDDKDWGKFIGLKELFEFATPGVNTARDEWVFDNDKINLKNKIEFLIENYNNLLISKNISFPNIIKWSEGLKTHFNNNKKLSLIDTNNIILFEYRPFYLVQYYSDKNLSDRLTSNHFSIWGNNLIRVNKVICISGLSSTKIFQCYLSNKIVSFDFLEKTQCLPLYRYDSNGNKIENITDWGLEQFQNNYNDNNINKEDIFHYVYAVLHNPQYRKKYELNLKREFPRIPFYGDFWKWSDWGKKLMDLHINFETIEPFPLNISTTELNRDVYKPKLKANKDTGEIYLDNQTTLSGIPADVWDYKLGNRSALEWILDQYKEKKPKDPTIAEKFNTYKFIDYKDKVIDLLMRVTTVSIETVKIVKEMEE
jgi:predicted helicase